MKKFLLLGIAMVAMGLSSCERDPYFDDPYHDFHQDDGANWHRNNGGDANSDEGDSSGSENSGDSQDEVEGKTNSYTITKLYSVVMRRELPYPFSAYVLQVENKAYFYMMRYRYNQDFHVGDKINFSVFTNCPNEIAVINGYDLRSDESAYKNADTDAGSYLVASDPIEATVKSMFRMKIRYSLTFWPIDTWFIETTDGNLVFIKDSKLKVALSDGDRIVYNVYTLFPNEVLALKKL